MPNYYSVPTCHQGGQMKVLACIHMYSSSLIRHSGCIGNSSIRNDLLMYFL